MPRHSHLTVVSASIFREDNAREREEGRREGGPSLYGDMWKERIANTPRLLKIKSPLYCMGFKLISNLSLIKLDLY